MIVKKKRELLRYSYIVSGIAIFLGIAAMFFDSQISRYFDDDNLMPIRKLAKSMTDVGLSENFFIISIVTFLIFHWLFHETKIHPRIRLRTLFGWLKTWALNFFVALIFSGFFLHVFKFIFGRARPHITEPVFDGFVFKFFQYHHHYQSMPSGHAQTLGTAATMFALLWPKASWFVYLVAAVFAFTRVVVHAHFLSDVIIGLALGHVSTLWCLHILENRYPKTFSLSKLD